MVANRERIKELRWAYLRLQSFVIKSETTQDQKDRLFEEINRLRVEIAALKAKNPEEEAEVTELEFNSKISEIWTIPKK